MFDGFSLYWYTLSLKIINLTLLLQKTDDEDSGNDEPVDLYYNDRRASHADRNSSQDSTPIVSSPSDSPDRNRPLFFPNFNHIGDVNRDEGADFDPNHENPHRNHVDPHQLQLDLGNLAINQDADDNQQHDVLEEDFQSPEEESVANDDQEPEDHQFLMDLQVIPFEPVKNYDMFPERGESSRSWNLSKRLDLLTNYKSNEPKSISELGLVERLPPEVLLAVFSHLDDVSLWSAANVCRRWYNLVNNHTTPELWQAHCKLRWPLFKAANGTVRDWYRAYDRLASSVPCKTCLSQTSLHHLRPIRIEENSWRRNRLRIELKGLRSDPPEGIAATPLDQKCCHWQATITGPSGSPYEGGIFYLYLQVPYRCNNFSYHFPFV